ncbi:MAG: hypothetical protein KJ890_15500 [Gammaproteobacteria bacterium]|nr:hypothetical protein [Gammaproteobacteria bacterium]MBU0801661.1 hypothetical protein [Alphaproteobacteria bacterium]MBU1803834.1 hypothetical protein [Gammaproteobacteria bacterium]
MLTTLPFSGFYQSFHDADLDDALQQMFTDDHGICNDKLFARAYGMVRWGLVHANYAAAYAKDLAYEFKVALTFHKLESPREYNFETDRIICEISLDEVKRLRAETSEKPFRDFARQRFTSRSGFISFYPPDVDGWGDIETWDLNQVGTLLEAYIEEQHGGRFDHVDELEIMESARANGRLDEWIIKATSGIGRLLTIYDYLQERAA